jgi:hypothetical protein
MKRTNSSNKQLYAQALLIAGILVVIPFHAFLTVWLASIFGHYTLLRLWKEFLLLALVGSALIVLARDGNARRQFFKSRLVQLMSVYLFMVLVWGLVSYKLHDVTAKALAYGWIVDARFPLFFLAVWVIAGKTSLLKTRWPAIVVWPALIVSIFGLLQYFVLPYDILKHVGYNNQTILPYQTINDNINHIRIMSTLRGANPLGAYLIVVLSLAFAQWRGEKKKRYVILGVSGVLALLLTFSRSALLGLLVSAALLVWLGLKSERTRRIVSLSFASLIVIVLATVGILRNNTSVQDALFHTDDKSTISVSSNQGHESGLKSGVHDVLHQPLGRGPGTAGPASVYNNNKVRIAENYFVQIGQEFGWLGLVLFLAINYLVARELWYRRDQPLALGLFTAFIGLQIVNLLSHAWADDTLAYFWWGLAGVAIAEKPKLKKT